MSGGTLLVPEAGMSAEEAERTKRSTAAEVAHASDRSIMVILAHPDDESFGIGGTLARYAAEGISITLVCATRGEAGIPGLALDETGRLRERELRMAALTLGIARVQFLGYRDGELSQADPNEVIARLVEAMQKLRPEIVITFGPDGVTGHPDHVAIHHLATRAFRRAELPPTSCLYYILPSEATEQGCGVPVFREEAPGLVVSIDVDDFRVTKVEAMQCHASQHPPYPGPPEEEAPKLVCHEYFTLALPAVAHEEDENFPDLFAPLAHLSSTPTGLAGRVDQ